MTTGASTSPSAPERTNGHAATAPGVPDRLVVRVGRGAHVLVCSDLHLAAAPTEASRLVATELADRLAALAPLGAVVLNGDCFELLAGRPAGVGAALDAHPGLQAALRAAAGSGAAVVVIAGNHDGRLAWDAGEAAALGERLGARVCLAVDLVLDTGRGERVVRVEHGHRFDPANAFHDPRNPHDSPLGHHVVTEILPAIEARPFLRDTTWLADPNDFSRLLGSRVVYRQLARHAWWLVVPALLALLLRTPAVVGALADHRAARSVGRWLWVAGIGVTADALVLALVAVLVARRVFSSLAADGLGPRGSHLNEPPRTAGEALCAEGFAGFVTGHTHHPELTPVPGGFYANSGCGVRSVEGRAARGGLPPVFAAVERRSWVELHATYDLIARLWLAETPVADGTLLERLVVRRGAPVPSVPTAVAEAPSGSPWPVRHGALADVARRERVRRAGSVGALLVAAVGLASSLTPPLRGRLHWLLQAMPVEVPQVASSGLVFASVGLALTARGLRRGLRPAWLATAGLLAVSVALNVTKGVDVEEAAVALALLLWLLAERGHFSVRTDTARRRRATLVAAVGAVAALGVSAVLVAVLGAHRRVDRDETLLALAERLAGRRTLPLPGASPFIGPALTAAGIGLAAAALWLLFSPGREPRPTAAQHHADRERARAVVAAHGGDTLAYFALRDDKTWFFSGASVVAYAVRNGVCLVSPDPIGPADERVAAWTEFRSFADRHGWSIAVVAAQPGWVAVYEATGMRSIYMGDEAIVDCQSFTLDGGPMKSVRGAYNRVAKAGYTVEFVDPATLPAQVEADLREIMTQTRQGDAERGFSMTLSRIFDPDDTGLLLAVARNRDGRADAFCHYVPAADVDGWSLDLMRRRADPDLPNGLTDFVIIETIRHLQDGRRWGLGLNFAVMRAVMAGELEGGLHGLERRVLHKFSETMQIESLWRYNEKFRPYWRPRYVMLGSAEHAAAQGIAIADAEAVWELPVIGRFLGRRA